MCREKKKKKDVHKKGKIMQLFMTANMTSIEQISPLNSWPKAFKSHDFDTKSFQVLQIITNVVEVHSNGRNEILDQFLS